MFLDDQLISRDIHYRMLQTIQMKLILLCVWAERTVFGSTKTALKYYIYLVIHLLEKISSKPIYVDWCVEPPCFPQIFFLLAARFDI